MKPRKVTRGKARFHPPENGPGGNSGSMETFDVKIQKPEVEAFGDADDDEQLVRPVLAGMILARSFQGDWFVQGLVGGPLGALANDAGVPLMAHLKHITAVDNKGKTTLQFDSDTDASVLLQEIASLRAAAMEGRLRTLSVTLKVRTLLIFSDALADSGGGERFRVGDSVEVKKDDSWVFATVMHGQGNEYDLRTESNVLSAVEASEIRWAVDSDSGRIKYEPWPSQARVREAAVTLLRSIATVSDEQPNGSEAAVLQLKEFAFLPVSAKGAALSLHKAESLCLPKNLDQCFTVKKTLVSLASSTPPPPIDQPRPRTLLSLSLSPPPSHSDLSPTVHPLSACS